MGMRKKILSGPWRIRNAVVGVVLLLILLEVGLRVIGLGNPVVYSHDPDSGYLPTPNQNLHRFFHLNYVNAFSMRSADISARKPTGVYRVMFIGDSVTYGTTFVDQADIFTSILQRDLPALLHRPVEVLNASAGAWAPGNEEGYLRSHGIYDADLVVFVLNTGDLNQPFNDQSLSLVSGYPEHRPLLAIEEFWVRYIEPRLTRHSTADAGSTVSGASGETIKSAKILQSLERAQKICEARGAKFAILYVPSHGGGWDTAQYADWLKDLHIWAEDQGAPILDAGPDLAVSDWRSMYFDGVHLRPAGDLVVARMIEQNWPAFSRDKNSAQPSPRNRY
jgi:hypothetical protein